MANEKPSFYCYDCPDIPESRWVRFTQRSRFVTLPVGAKAADCIGPLVVREGSVRAEIHATGTHWKSTDVNPESVARFCGRSSLSRIIGHYPLNDTIAVYATDEIIVHSYRFVEIAPANDD